MPEASTLALFTLAAITLLVIPGPAVLYIVTRSVAQGRTAGLVSMLGVHVGSMVHVAAAVLGISAVLASSATAFTIVKYAGAAYLVWLGISQFRSKPGKDPVAVATEPAKVPSPGRDASRESAPSYSRRRLFTQGVVVNVLNPKTAIFFLAFLPQFVDPSRGPVTLQLAIFGVLFILLGIVSDGAYALTAGTVAAPLLRSVRSRRRLSRTSGAIYLGMGVTAALAREAT